MKHTKTYKQMMKIASTDYTLEEIIHKLSIWHDDVVRVSKESGYEEGYKDGHYEATLYEDSKCCCKRINFAIFLFGFIVSMLLIDFYYLIK